MDIKLIKTEKDYEQALERLEMIFDASPKTKEGKEAKILLLFIENYENKYWRINN